LAGRPNVGKSSLLNALLAEDRALVSSVSGTTRDVVSAALELAGIRIELADTAGLDEPRDELEALGMARTNEWLAKADLILLLLDRSRPLSKNDIELYEKISSRPHLLLLNKVDLPAAFSGAELSCRLRCSDLPITCVARRGRAEIEDLRQALSDFVAKAAAKSENAAVILNQRHYERLAAFVAALERALVLSENRIQLDLLAEELQQARQALLEILGREQAAVETLLDVVFEQFCIGK
jgi:tRNA modification GTPase